MPSQPQSPAADVNALRPQVLDHYVGQQGVVERVKIALESSWNDGTPLPHMLFTGPPGLGKTQLAQILAREMGVDLKQSLAQNLNQSGLLRGFLLSGDDRDVLFVDEIHELTSNSQTLLYRAMEERQLSLVGSDGESAPINLSNFTLLGATTDQFALLSPLLDRFRVIGHFSKYSAADLGNLLKQRCHLLGWRVEDHVVAEVAQRGRGTPRLALRLLESCRRTARASGHDAVTQKHFERTCQMECIDSAGLNEVEQAYLKLLLGRSGVVRLNVVASSLALPTATVQKLIEPPLIEDGFIEKMETGSRMLTTKGRNHVLDFSSRNQHSEEVEADA